jgi:hypothetical protein
MYGKMFRSSFPGTSSCDWLENIHGEAAEELLTSKQASTPEMETQVSIQLQNYLLIVYYVLFQWESWHRSTLI